MNTKFLAATQRRNVFIITFLYMLLPGILRSEPRFANIGMVSMEATHNFRSSLLTKINEVKPLIEEAGRLNIDLIAIPEAYFRGRTLLDDSQNLSESVVLDSMKVFAQANNINIIFQVVEQEGDKYYNTAVVLDRDGTYVGKYRKVNLPPEESALTPGDSYKVFDLDFGKVGILICWDGWFTEPAKALVENGAEIIVIPTWCNIQRNLETITAENGIPMAYAILRINCGAGDENLPSSVYNHHGDLISSDLAVGQNKIAIGSVTLGNYKNLSLGKKVLASDSNSENPVENVVDGKYSTERDAPTEKQTSWQVSSLPQWIDIDLGAEYDIDRVSMAMFDTDEYDFLIEGRATDGNYFILSDSVTKYETFLEHGIAGSEITSTRFGIQASQKTHYVRITINSSTKSEIQINEIKVFGYPEPGLTAIDESESNRIPVESRLLPNYPNPFNPETMIQYVLQEDSDVRLTVYNLNGQMVKELVKKSLPAGPHMVKWNGKNQNFKQVSSGVYVAQIEMESNSGKVITDSQKIVLVR